MASLNSCSFIGNVGKEPELRFSAAGKPVLKFPIAVSNNKRVNNEWTSETLWVNVTQIGDQAERNADVLAKGSPVFAEGKLEVRTYERKDGGTGVSVDLLANKVLSLAKRESASDDWPKAVADDDGDLPFQ